MRKGGYRKGTHGALRDLKNTTPFPLPPPPGLNLRARYTKKSRKRGTMVDVRFGHTSIPTFERMTKPTIERCFKKKSTRLFNAIHSHFRNHNRAPSLSPPPVRTTQIDTNTRTHLDMDQLVGKLKPVLKMNGRDIFCKYSGEKESTDLTLTFLYSMT